MDMLKLVAICGSLSVAVIAVGGTAAAAPQSTTVDTQKAVPFTAPSPCTGEDMVGIANLHDVVVVNTDGTGHLTETIQGIKAVGLFTNLTYTGSEELLVTDQNLPPTDVLSSDMTTKLIRTGDVAGPFGSPDDLYIRFHIHATVNANGDVSSSFFNPTVECR